MRQITVLGADGFLGRHLITRLADEDVKIIAFDHFSTLKKDPSYVHPFKKMQNVTICSGDFLNSDDIKQSIQGSDFVFHLISSTNPATSMNNPVVDIDTNIHGSVQLFKACVEAKIKKVIFFSSGGTVYGDIDSDNISENARLSPLSPYAIGKVTIEYYLEYFKRAQGLDYLTYRIANPYGPGQNIYGKQGVVPIFMRHFLEGKPITIYGDGEMVRDYIYIDDLLDLIESTYDKTTLYTVYNVGSGHGSSVNDIVSAIEEVSATKTQKNHIEAPSVYVKRSVLDIDRITTEFNIYPKTSLQEGIERTWDYVKSI